MAANEYQSVLMVIPNENWVFPVSTFAFTVTQGSSLPLERYLGAVVLYRSGALKEIVSIKKTGIYGSGFGARLKNLIFGAHGVETDFEDSDIEFSDFKKILIQSLKHESGFEIENLEMVEQQALRSKNAQELFDALPMPDTNECLDVL